MESVTAGVPALRGDSASGAARDFTTFFDAEFGHVAAATYLFCGDREVARDAAQEAFTRAWARWRRLTGQRWITGWVMTTAFNVSRRSLRRRGRESGQAPGLGAGGDPEALVWRVDLVEALRGLSTRQRQMVVLYYVGGHSVADIAEAAGISEGAVKTHLARGRKALRAALGVSEKGSDDA